MSSDNPCEGLAGVASATLAYTALLYASLVDSGPGETAHAPVPENA